MRCTLRSLLLNVTGESPSFRAKPGMSHPLFSVHNSPYKEQFKDYWATPVPFADRSYGEKPKVGDPVPARRAATTILVGKNSYADPAAVECGEENDYKVLMMYREGRGRFVKDQFILPSAPVTLQDSHEDWPRLLRRRGMVTNWSDLHHRLTAMRALVMYTNLLLIPKEGGAVAEVESVPGVRRWHLLIHSHPEALRRLIDVLELPMESTLAQLLPFREIETPTSETFRFLNRSYLVTIAKLPEVELTLSVNGEKLVWVSPTEAVERFNAGIMNMPTPNLIALSELSNACPTFADVCARTHRSPTRLVRPQLFHHGQSRVATVLLPGDVHHPDTTTEDQRACFVRRLMYEKDFPFGVRAVLEERPASVAEMQAVLEPAKPALLEEATELDRVYAAIPYPERQRGGLTHGSEEGDWSCERRTRYQSTLCVKGQMA